MQEQLLPCRLASPLPGVATFLGEPMSSMHIEDVVPPLLELWLHELLDDAEARREVSNNSTDLSESREWRCAISRHENARLEAVFRSK